MQKTGIFTESDAPRVVSEVVPDQAGEIELLGSRERCSGTTVKNDANSIESARKSFYIRARIFFAIAVPIALISVITILLILPAVSKLAWPMLPLAPFILMIVAAAILVNLAFRDDTTAKILAKAMRNPPAEKKYIVVYSCLKTLIHELYHIKKGHLEKEGGNLKQDFEIRKEVRKEFREIREKLWG